MAIMMKSSSGVVVDSLLKVGKTSKKAKRTKGSGRGASVSSDIDHPPLRVYKYKAGYR
jgi:hypothetical protein